MKVDRSKNVAKIIDGQHRIAGLEEYNGPEFELNVTIFVDMDLEDQALLFATINLKQTRVSKSLAYDLFEFATKVPPTSQFDTIFEKIQLKESDFSSEKYNPGAGGESDLYKDLMKQSGLPA
jgi:DGQHR domain-containing protein